MKITETSRLVLRTARVDDAPFYLALVNDPDFITHIADRNLRTIEAARQALIDGPIAMQQARGHAMYVVALKDGTPIGMSGLIKRDALPDVDIGYAFLAAYRGHGYAHEAACAVLQHARALGFERIMAITSQDNAASIHLLEKCGLRFQGVQAIAPYTTASNVYLAELSVPDAP
ncbi:MAG: GNAT family N-acetyltransferase [Pseudomonadota bacterium]|nr:GNAT family N-acetyltransferase [Pseudomonadota bacterium]